ncbi:MAG: YraN family protein [Armatimonadetes bacterium]|nr:YraN family protein [Armatimonadota bacterium]
MTRARIALGASGEDLAAEYLQGKGFRILSRNYRTPLGELDLVARHKDVLVFVEVKTRRSVRFGAGFEAVGPDKQRRLSRMAVSYMVREKVTGVRCRFDVVSIQGDRKTLVHIPNAFEMVGEWMG